MVLSPTLVASGRLHSTINGNIIAGAGEGEVAGIGAAQPVFFNLLFDRDIQQAEGFQDQFYVIISSTDGNITNMVLDTPQFTAIGGGLFQINFLADVAALPAGVFIELEAHHSTGR